MRLGYAAIMLLAVTVGFVALSRSQRSLKFPWQQRVGLGFGAFVGAMVGAKLPFLFVDWARFLNGSAWFADGKTILTGLVGGYLGVEIAKWTMDLRTRTGDSFVIPVALTIAIGRLGCFYAGCCYGATTDMPWGIVFSGVDALPRHPNQLYEAAFHLCAAGMFFEFQRRDWFRRHQIQLYIIVYSAFRFFTEWLRPEPILAWGLTGYQYAALIIIVLFVWLWRVQR